VESVQNNFDTVVYNAGIKTDKNEIFKKMPFYGINPPQNTSHLAYITLPITSDNMLITNSFFPFKKSTTSINEVIRFLENQFGDPVYKIPQFKYTSSGAEVSSEIHKIEMMYCTLINFCY
jgi:hypothetical protein